MKRLENFRKRLAEMGVDAVMVYDELNQHYLSGFAFTDGLLLITKNRALLITDFRYYEMAKAKAFSDFEIVMPENRREAISEVLASEECKTVGFEGGFLPYANYAKIKESYPEYKFVDIGDAIEEQRQIKDEREIEYMKKAQEITDKAFSHILRFITPNVTEMEVAAELEYFMRKNGADGLAFDTIAVSGDASALPHGTPRNVKLKKGFLTMDFGAKYEGYCSDMTRTVVIGKADEEIKKLYYTTLNAQQAALDFLKAGADAGEADKVARDIIDAHPEFKGAFGHSLGHSVGLFIHEAPRVSQKAFGRALRAGEIVTVEPGIYLSGRYGCRIEDMVKIEEGGIYNFTQSTKDLIEII